MPKIFLVAFIFLTSCQPDLKFNPDDWKNFSYTHQNPGREQMIDDLTENQQLRGIHLKKLFGKLGPPDFSRPMSVAWQLTAHHEISAGPGTEKVIEFRFNSDSIVVDYIIAFPAE